MRAKVWRSAGTFGVRVGAANRDAYFGRGWEEIEVEMEGVVHRFTLTPGFWHKCPEFRDSGGPVIRDWLTRRGLATWPRGRPPGLELEPLGGNRFRLGV